MQACKRRGLVLGITLGILTQIIAARVDAVSYSWTGGNGSDWSNSGNWSGGAPLSSPSASLTFASAGNYSVNPNNDLASPFNLWQLTVASGAPAVHLTGSSLAFSATSQSGIYQNASAVTIIDNPLSWATGNTLTLSVAGSGGLALTGGLTTATTGSVTKSGNGSLTFTGSSSLAGTFTANGGTTAVSGGSLGTANLTVGNTAPATMTISGSTTKVNVGNELDVNYQATASGSTAYLNLQGGTLNVVGPTIIGRARMDTTPADASAQVVQTGGLFAASGPMTIGQFGAAQSVYNASGGTLRAASGLVVGSQGNGALNISTVGNVVVSGTQGLSIGSDPSGATGGIVNLSGGTLAVSNNLLLGNSGVGTLVRSTGALSVGGNLVASGAGTLVLNGSAGSVATYFGGQPTHNGTGTLVVIPQSGQPSGNEAVTFGQSPNLSQTSNILGPWAVRQLSGSDSRGDYLTLSGTTGPYSLATANYTSTNFASSSGTSVVNVTGSPAIGATSAYAAKFGSGSTTTLNDTLAIVSGGMILNGGTLNGNGSVSFGEASPATGMIFAGSSTASVVAAPLATTMGLVKFGPGTLVLSGSNSSLTGGIIISSGVLNAQNRSALGPGGIGNDLLVAAGAALEIQNNIALPAVQVSISGTGVSSGGALRNISGGNSLAGLLSLTNNLQIATDSGSLTLSSPIQGSYNVTKTGTGTLALTADSSNGFSGSIAVTAGVLDVSNSGALGMAGGGATTISSGAALVVHGDISLPAESITLAGSGVGGSGVLRNTQGNNAMASPLSLSAPSQISIDAGSLTLVGVVSGNGGLTKTGSGILTLANTANYFSSPLAVTAGTLSVSTVNNSGSLGPLGLAASAVALGTSGGTGTFDYSGSGNSSNRPFSIATSSTGVFQIDHSGANLALSGPLTGSGALLKTGPGILTISGSASVSGSTRVAQGVLAIDPGGSLNNTASITVCPATSLQLTNSGSNQLPDTASVSLQAGALTFSGNGSTANGETTGNLLLGAGQNDIMVSRSTGTYQPWLRFANFPTSHTTGSTVNFTASNAQVQFQVNPGLANGIMGGYAYYGGSDFATSSGGTVQAYASYVTGDLGTLTSNTTANVKPTGTQSLLTAATSVNSLNLSGSASVQMSGTGALTLASGGLIANTTGGIAAGVLKGSASGELTVNTVQDLAVSSMVADNGGPTALVKTGTGALTLSGTNAYTGDTFVNQGILVYNPPANATYAGAIHGMGNVTKSSTATLTLSGTSDNFGTTTIAAGGLCVNGSLGPGGVVALQAAAVLSGSGTISGNVTATGGSIALAPSGNILGSVTVASGTLAVGTSGTGNYLATSGGLFVAGAGAIVATPAATILGNVNYSSSANSNYAGLISGSGSILTLNAPAGTTLTLSNTASATNGGTVLQGGTLRLANTAALGSNPVTVNGGLLDLNGLANETLASLAGTGGTVGTSSSNSTLTINPASGVLTNFSGTLTNSQGVLKLVKAGSGALTLSGTNSYTGGTTVSGGALIIANAHGLPLGGSLTIGDSAGAGDNAASGFLPAVAVASLPIDTGETEVSRQSLFALSDFGPAIAAPASAIIESGFSLPTPPDSLPVGGGSMVGSTETAPVPEPGTLALLFVAILGRCLIQRRTKVGG